MQTSNRIIALFLTAVVVLTATSCRNGTSTQNPGAAQTADREGNPVTLPQKFKSMIPASYNDETIRAGISDWGTGCQGTQA